MTERSKQATERMAHPSSSTAGGEGWKRYPLTLGDDLQLMFPAAEGDLGGTTNRYAVSGRLTGRASGSQWGFLVIMSGSSFYGRFHTDFRTVALFDLGTGAYGTSTELDYPRLLRRRASRRLAVGSGALDVTFQADSGVTALRARRDAEGESFPFAYTLHAEGLDADARRMALDLELDGPKPPVPIGGNQHRRVETWIGHRETRACFQSGVRARGALAWGDAAEEVDGDCGWIDHQWSARLAPWNAARYGSERRQIHLDNGIEIAVWTQIDRRRGNRVIPYSGATAAGPRGEIDATTNVRVDTLSFARDPRDVEAVRPSEGPKYFADRYRLLIPGWDLDLVSEPIVATPAHGLPRDYWNGPTRVRGTLGRRSLSGFGFDERTHPLTRDFELADVLRQTLLQLPADATPSAAALADLAWEIDAMISRGDRESAIAYLDGRVRPEIDALPDLHRARLRQIVHDTSESLLRWWVRPKGTSSSA